MANSIFIKADELAKELDISQGLAYKMIAQWNEELRAKGYTTVGGRVSRRYYQEKIYGAGAVSYTHLDVYKRQVRW